MVKIIQTRKRFGRKRKHTASVYGGMSLSGQNNVLKILLCKYYAWGIRRGEIAHKVESSRPLQLHLAKELSDFSSPD